MAFRTLRAQERKTILLQGQSLVLETEASVPRPPCGSLMPITKIVAFTVVADSGRDHGSTPVTLQNVRRMAQ
jgi:hypothetical protein